MDSIGRKGVLAVALLGLCCAGGCTQQKKTGAGALNPATADLGPTIGSLVTVRGLEPVAVEGYGLVGGLKGTGSSDCPPAVRAYLAREVRRQLPERGTLDIDKFLSSPDTAAVLVEGVFPEIPFKNAYFDVKVTALPSTQTTSLSGGGLLLAELKMQGNLAIETRMLADAKGPIFIDKISETEADTRTGYILAGGKILDDYRVILELHQSDFRVASGIRNLVNGRFGETTAQAVQPNRVDVLVPARYREHPQRFVSVINAMFLTQDPQVTIERTKMLLRRLAESQDKYDSEVALEAIGNRCLSGLQGLLNSGDERIRLSAGRCALNLGSDAGLAALRRIAMNKGSTLRLEALEAAGTGAPRNDTAALARTLLDDEDFSIRLMAYEQLRKLDDVTISQTFVGRNFYLEQVTRTKRKAIFVSRSGQPRIVLFGAPIQCEDNIFVQSREGDITINSAAGQNYVTLIRKHPKRTGVVAQAQSSSKLDDIIKALCEEPPKEGNSATGGLGVTYADAIAFVKQMCDKGAVDAEFHAGPLPKIGLNVKK